MYQGEIIERMATPQANLGSDPWFNNQRDPNLYKQNGIKYTNDGKNPTFYEF